MFKDLTFVYITCIFMWIYTCSHLKNNVFLFSLLTRHAQEASHCGYPLWPGTEYGHGSQVLVPLHTGGCGLAGGCASHCLQDIPLSLHWLRVIGPHPPTGYVVYVSVWECICVAFLYNWTWSGKVTLLSLSTGTTWSLTSSMGVLWWRAHSAPSSVWCGWENRSCMVEGQTGWTKTYSMRWVELHSDLDLVPPCHAGGRQSFEEER